MTLAQRITEKLNTLPVDKQQEVLDFVEFLQSKAKREQTIIAENTDLSFLEAAGDFIGCVEGPGALSTNPKYMEGYGQS